MIDTQSPLPAAKSSAPKRATQRKPRRTRWIVLGVLLAILVAAGLLIGPPARAGWRAWRAADALRETVGAGLESADAAQVTQEIVALDAAVQQMADGMRPFQPLLRRLDWLPTWGPTLAAAPELMAFGREFSAMGADVAPLTGVALAEEEMPARATAFVGALGEEPARIQRLAVRAEAAAAAYKSIPIDTLHPALASRLENAGPLLDVLPKLLGALPGLPVLLGMDEPHTLLVLVHNNHELRPTGGFITAVGRVTIDNGEIAELDFQDSYDIYKRTSHYPSVPAPMETYMGIPYMTFRDSNWSPDLPTSSEIARAIYTMDTGLEFDDVVTIDLNAVELIIAALSPLHLEGIDESVTGENILEIIKELWARPADAEADIEGEDLGAWWRERKSFIPKLAQAAVAKVMGGDADYLALAAAAVQALEQRDIQLYSNIDAVSPVLADLGWDGALQPLAGESSDFLALVDTNMGYNKANAAIERTLDYTVTWPVGDETRPLAEVTITYTHTYTGAPTLCEPRPLYGNSYDEMVQRCYFNYLRLYVPGGSTLEEMTGVQEETVATSRGEQGTQVFAGYFSLETNSSNRVTIRYRLPEGITADEYILRIQRQSGTKALPVSLRIGDVEDQFVLDAGRIDWVPPQ